MLEILDIYHERQPSVNGAGICSSEDNLTMYKAS